MKSNLIIDFPMLTLMLVATILPCMAMMRQMDYKPIIVSQEKFPEEPCSRCGMVGGNNCGECAPYYGQSWQDQEN